MTSKVRFRDRLRDRGFIDQTGFLAFATIGFLAIISAKYFDVQPRWVTTGAIAAMLLYAFVIARAGTGRVRADQAGDNCYYLGLIYTLASLSYAIGTFDPNETASTIVQGFGVALATTIVGLILRVYFNQGRPDLENAEEQIRLELTEATARIKRELSSVGRQLNDLGRQLDQSIREAHDAAIKTMQDFANVSMQGVQDTASAASQAIRAEANDFATRSKTYTTTFNNLLSRLEEHNEHLAELNASHNALAVTARSAADAATSAAASVDSLSRSASLAASAIASVEGAAGATTKILHNVEVAATTFQSTLSTIREETERQLTQLRTGPSTAVREAVEAMQSGVSDLREEIVRLTETHVSARDRLADQSAAAVDVARRHNAELEAELKRSRELVSRVHSALAEMTGRLADAVEPR